MRKPIIFKKRQKFQKRQNTKQSMVWGLHHSITRPLQSVYYYYIYSDLILISGHTMKYD